jgi:hypothetical protein
MLPFIELVCKRVDDLEATQVGLVVVQGDKLSIGSKVK